MKLPKLSINTNTISRQEDNNHSLDAEQANNAHYNKILATGKKCIYYKKEIHYQNDLVSLEDREKWIDREGIEIYAMYDIPEEQYQILEQFGFDNADEFPIILNISDFVNKIGREPRQGDIIELPTHEQKKMIKSSDFRDKYRDIYFAYTVNIGDIKSDKYEEDIDTKNDIIDKNVIDNDLLEDYTSEILENLTNDIDLNDYVE